MYSYTPAGRIRKVTDQEGAETEYGYDAVEGRKEFTYTPKGQIATVKEADGAVTRYGYGCDNIGLNQKTLI